jgi:hypothetical protein
MEVDLTDESSDFPILVVTLNDINKKIHAPRLYKIKIKSNEGRSSHEASAISGKPIVHKTKIHTEGGKGSITITRTLG